MVGDDSLWRNERVTEETELQPDTGNLPGADATAGNGAEGSFTVTREAGALVEAHHLPEVMRLKDKDSDAQSTEKLRRHGCGSIVSNLRFYHILIVGGFVAVAIEISRMGEIRLGRDDERPEFGLLPWFAMLFAADRGIGLVFYSVGELLGYITAEVKPGWDGSETEMAGNAMP